MSTPGAVPIRPSPQKPGTACLVLAPTPAGSQPAQVVTSAGRSLVAARGPRRPLPPPPGRTLKRRGAYSAYVPAPQPTNVLRRNARERNRVKQVNHGFAALRNHIPGAAKNKKLSKVDTLRRAMEYIQSLQQQLEEHAEGRLAAEEEAQPTPPAAQTEAHFNGYLTPGDDYPSTAAGYLTPPGYLTPCEEQPVGYLTPQSSPLPGQPSPLTLTPSSLASVDSGVCTSESRGYSAGTLQACPDTPSPTPSYEPAARPEAAAYSYADDLDYHGPDGDLSPEDEELLDAIAWWQTSQ